MRLSFFATALAFLGAVSNASPTSTFENDKNLEERANVVKRATITDVPTTGYATQNGGTTGGKGGTTTTVSTLAQFTAAVAEGSARGVVVISGTISGSQQVRIGSDKTIIGLPGATFDGVGLFIWKQSNVIVRNIISRYVLAANGDGLTIQKSTNVWVDHCEFYSDLTHDKDYYDGLLDVSHASEWVTISNTYFHDHWKTSLVGHSDKNGAEDTGHLHVTYHNNYWRNLGSRTPSVRFGTVHVYNSYYDSMDTGIDSRDGAQMLVQSNVFRNCTEPIASLYSDDVGYVTAIDNDLGGAANTAPAGSLTASSMPYSYSLLGSANVKAAVVGTAGATLTF